MIGMLCFNGKPLEKVYKSSTCTNDGQLPPENHTFWQSRYLGFLFQGLIPVISVNSCKEQTCCYLVEIKCDIMVGWSANMSSKSHCPRSPHRLSCILEPQADANKMLVPTVSRRYRHAAQMTPVLKTSRAKMRVYQALDLL